MTRAGFGRAVLLCAASAAAGAAADDSRLIVGIRGGVDVVAASSYANQPEHVAGEIFVRKFLSASLALEGAVGYRTAAYDSVQGWATTSFWMSQVPLTAGAVWVFSPGQAFRPRVGAGIAILPTKSKSTVSALPGREETVEMSTTVVGGYAEGGLQAPIYENLTADVSLRYVLNPVPQESGKPASQNYFSALFGLSARF